MVLIFASYQVYKLYIQKSSLDKGLADIDEISGRLGRENEQLQADIEYFQRPENLEKELKSRFNYVRPGEKMMIIVPKSKVKEWA